MRRQRNLLGPQGMGGMVSLWGASSLIKSRQSGFVTMGVATQGNTTITAVNMSHSVLIWDGWYHNLVNNNYPRQWFPRIALQSATNVRADVDTTSGVDGVLYFTVIEFLPGIIKSVQRVSIQASGTGIGNTTIIEVNLSKTFISWHGFIYNGTEQFTTSDPKQWSPYITLTTSTNAQVARPGTSHTLTQYAEVVEFF